jgi:hypothetical protein
MQKLRCVVCSTFQPRERFSVDARVNGGIRLGMNPIETTIGGRLTLIERRGNVCVACYADLRRCACGRMGALAVPMSARGAFCEICERTGIVQRCPTCTPADAHFVDRDGTQPEYPVDRASVLSSSYRVFDVLPVARLIPGRMYFGIEMEFEVSGFTDPESVAAEFSESAGQRAFVKDDGSLTYGVECVSIPLELDDARNYLRDVLTDDFWSNIDRATTERTAGMHVHVSRCAVGRRATARALLFLHSNANMGLVNELAGRDLETWGSNGQSYAPLTEIDINQVVRDPRHDQRYRALNVMPRTTIEFRLFGPPSSLKRALVNLEAAAAIVGFAKSAVAAEELTRPEGFLAFVEREKVQYPALAAHLAAVDRSIIMRTRAAERALSLDVDPALVA